VKPQVCPDGFQQLTPGKSCFKVILGKDKYDAKVKQCNAFHPGSDLAVITNQAEQDTIAKYIKGLPQSDRDGCGLGFYIGLGRKDPSHCPAGAKGSDFVWKSVALCDDPITYTNWFTGQPDGCDGIAVGGQPRESCGHLRTDYRWNDLPCDLQLCGVCTISL